MIGVNGSEGPFGVIEVGGIRKSISVIEKLLGHSKLIANTNSLKPFHAEPTAKAGNRRNDSVLVNLETGLTSIHFCNCRGIDIAPASVMSGGVKGLGILLSIFFIRMPST